MTPKPPPPPPVPSGLEPEQTLGVKTHSPAWQCPQPRGERPTMSANIRVCGREAGGVGGECPGRAGHEFKEGFLEEVRSVRRLYLEDEGLRGPAGVRKGTIIWKSGCQML